MREDTAIVPLPGKDVQKDEVSAALDEKSDELTSRIIAEEDPQKINELIDLFNLNQSKKDLVRSRKYNELLDKTTSMLEATLDSGEMTAGELIRAFTALQKTAARYSNVAEEIQNAPIFIQYNDNRQTEVVSQNVPQLSRESKEKVIEVINQILKEQQAQAIVPEEEEEEDDQE